MGVRRQHSSFFFSSKSSSSSLLVSTNGRIMNNRARAPIAPTDGDNRCALILPGGGMRVAYQAGAIKALHDAGIRFSVADGASGGIMNLASLLSGATPDELC